MIKDTRAMTTVTVAANICRVAAVDGALGGPWHESPCTAWTSPVRWVMWDHPHTRGGEI